MSRGFELVFRVGPYVSLGAGAWDSETDRIWFWITDELVPEVVDLLYMKGWIKSEYGFQDRLNKRSAFHQMTFEQWIQFRSTFYPIARAKWHEYLEERWPVRCVCPENGCGGNGIILAGFDQGGSVHRDCPCDGHHGFVPGHPDGFHWDG